jgi:hypothetical protein
VNDDAVVATPCGSLEGAPCLRVRYSEDVVPGTLYHTLSANQRPGVSVLWIENAPWGSVLWDQEIRAVLEAPHFSHVAVMACQPLTATRWSGSPSIKWVVDITDLLREQLTEERLIDYLQAVSYIPAVHDIVSFSPHVLNVAPAILDPLYQYLDPASGGYIYVPDAQAARTVQALSRCMHPWSQRYQREVHG